MPLTVLCKGFVTTEELMITIVNLMSGIRYS